MKKALITLLLLALISCTKKEILNPADVIYFGGDILTMEGETATYAEAVAIKDGKILFVGTKDEAEKFHGDKTEMKDLEGKTMMPGFVEPHVHPSIAATMLPNEIISMNDWVLPNEIKKGVIGHDEYIKRVTESINAKAKPEEAYLVWGYHQLWHGEISRDMLNKIAPNQPVGILHRSFHEIYVNDAFIKKFNIKEEDYKGNPQVEWKKGHFYEGGWLALVPKLGAVLFNPDRTNKGMEMMSQLIHKNGITTICEPGFGTSDFNMEFAMLKKEMDKGQPYEAYLIPNGTQLYTSQGSNEKALEFTKTMGKFNTDNIHFLPNQIKLFADGAIYSQAMQMEGNYNDGHKGEWMTPLNLLKTQMSLYWKAGYKIHVHANGDLGIQEVLNFNALDQKANPRKDHRLTLHHMGYFSEKQANQIANLEIEASVNPYYLWALADKYSEVGLGKERGEALVRIKSLLDNKIPVSFHSDFSMAPMEPLTLAWTAVNRVTSENSKFSQDQRIDAYSAMKAITITAARTIELEKTIGSIKKGKIANFTILAENPLKVKPMAIKDVKVLETVFKGKSFPIKQ
ncbi:amidohydrolase [Flavobacterium sp.]|uniref:amidohydrolase n=1 Tax=Flavobacterium sp. TaxID=239 RepID=UPI00286C1973|nr:amidohydrolase [Flavobacterium sp.]